MTWTTMTWTTISLHLRTVLLKSSNLTYRGITLTVHEGCRSAHGPTPEGNEGDDVGSTEVIDDLGEILREGIEARRGE